MTSAKPDSPAVSFMDLGHALWQSKWLVVAAIAVATGVAAAYVLLATPWYRSTTLLAPAEERALPDLSSGLGGLVGLANLSGITVGGGGSAEAVATLESRDFARSFIEANELLRVLLFEQWDEGSGQWKESDPEEVPDIRDAIEYFHENVLSVSQDSTSALVSLSIDWIDANDAARWAADLSDRLNRLLREKALDEAQRNVDYLREQLEETHLATLRESIGALLETELQKLMLARGKEDFVFEVIDSPQVPKKPIRPRPLLTVALAAFFGGFVVFSFVCFREFYRRGII